MAEVTAVAVEIAEEEVEDMAVEWAGVTATVVTGAGIAFMTMPGEKRRE